ALSRHARRDRRRGLHRPRRAAQRLRERDRHGTGPRVVPPAGRRVDGLMGGALSDVWFELTDLQLSHGSGAVVTTTDGVDYLDLTSGIGVTNTGHCHPHVVEAIREQAGRF